MMRFSSLKRLLLLVAVLVVGASSRARADLDVSLVGAGTRAQTAPSPIGMGFGILFDWPAWVIAKDLKIQFGFANLKRNYSDGTTNSEFNAYHFPVDFKWQLAKVFSVGLGGYYEMNGGGSGFASRGYGALASAALDLPLIPGIGWLVDVRYLYGLSDMGTGAASIKLQDAAVFTGIRLGFGR